MIALILFFFLTTILVWRYGINTYLLFIYSGLIISFGLFFYGDFGSETYLAQSLLCLCCLLLGFLFSKEAISGVMSENTLNFSVSIKSMFNTVVIVLLITAYHYYVAGVPFLSSNVDVSRFDLRSSGFFGIPSRFSVYMPVILFFVFAFYFRSGLFSLKQIIFIFLTVFLLFFLQGHKSSILQIIFLGVIAYSATNIKKTLENFFGWIFLAAVFSAYFAFEYLSSLSSWEYSDYFIARYTSIIHASGTVLQNLETKDFFLWNGSPIINDIMYPVLTVFSDEYQTVNEQLSRIIFYVPEEGFTVPVTPGFYAYHYFALGAPLLFIVSFIYGAIVGMLDKILIQSNKPLTKVISGYLIYWLYIGYISGNIYYLLINFSFCIVIFVAIYSFLSVTFKKQG